MECEQVSSTLNLLAQIIAKKTSTPFNHTIVVSTETGGGRYRLTQGRKVIVHPNEIASGMMLSEIITNLIDLIGSDEATRKAITDKDIKVYKKSGKEAIRFLRSHMSSEDFQTWIEKTVELV